MIISLSKARWKEFRGDSAFLQKNLHKVWIELPKFISEQSIPYYRDLCDKMFKLGYKQFMISHLSQSLIIPAGAQFSTNENVYAYNDAAVAEIKRSGAVNFSYPVENDHENLSSMRAKDGFVSLYFRPSLFLSRMPVNIDSEDDYFKDDRDREFQRVVIDGITHIIPSVPVSFLQYHDKLYKQGFRNFVIDLSFEPVTKNTVKKLMTRFNKSEQVQPSSNFNYKMGLK